MEEDFCLVLPGEREDWHSPGHGRARVAAGSLLIDRYRRGQAFDEVNVWLVHLPEKLTGVRRQALDVPSLTFRIDRVKGK